MRYLIPAAGVGRRLGNAFGALPKCMIEIGGEPIIGRLLRQIRAIDPEADINVVLGYRSEIVAPVVDGSRIILNPVFDVAGLDTSLWLARGLFDQPLMVIHADLVLSDPLVAALLAAEAQTLMAFDSSIHNPRDINVAVSAGQVVQFDENLAGFSGIYAGVLKLSRHAASAFAQTLDHRICRGLSDPHAYYLHVVRTLIEDCGIAISGLDIAGADWQEIDGPSDVAAARERFGGPPTGGLAPPTDHAAVDHASPTAPERRRA